MHRLPGLVFLFLPFCASADVVVPVESVTSHVNIRLSQDSASDIVGRLEQGDYLPLVASTESWHEVEIPGGATGFVSADWSTVLDEPPSAGEVEEMIEATAEADVPLPSVQDSPMANAEAPTGEEETTADVLVVDDHPEETMEAATAEDEAVAPDTDKSVDEAERTTDDSEAVAEEGAVAMDDPETVAGSAPVTIADDSIPAPQAGEEDVITESVTMQPEPESSLESQAADPSTSGESLVVAGPRGEPGPPGPAGAANIEGSVGFLARFTAPTMGGSSQIYDDGNNIGIGTTAPVQRLEVNGNIQIHERNSSVAGLMITQSDGETGYIMHNRASTLTIGAGSVDRITIDSDGNVGFGVSRPSHPIEMTSGAHVTSGGVWTNSSSRARKENIASLSLSEALNTLSGLEPVHFNYKNDQSESYIGFIAEDVPELVATRDRDGLSSMDIVAILTKVVQEQQKRLKELEARLDQR